MRHDPRDLDRALTLAHEIVRLDNQPDVVLAAQARRNLDDLIGYRTPGGKWTLPPVVRKILVAS